MAELCQILFTPRGEDTTFCVIPTTENEAEFFRHVPSFNIPGVPESTGPHIVIVDLNPWFSLSHSYEQQIDNVRKFAKSLTDDPIIVSERLLMVRDDKRGIDSKGNPTWILEEVGTFSSRLLKECG